jgi:hypothetical protein
MKTREEVESLKRSWRNDPIWDIEDTEGFEEHREELLAFRVEMEEKWAIERDAEREKMHPKRIGGYRLLIDEMVDTINNNQSPNYEYVNAQTQLIIARALIDIAESLGMIAAG